MASKKFGEILVESGLITHEQLAIALDESKRTKGMKLGAILVKNGFACELDIAQTLAFQLNLPFINLASMSIERDVTRLVSEKIASKYLCMPFEREGKTIKLAMFNPLNLHAVEDVRFSSGYTTQIYVATHADIVNAINRHYHLSEPLESFMLDIEKEGLVKDKYVELIHEVDLENDINEQVKKSSAPPIIKLVDSIIIHAVANRANDIHLEPQELNLTLRIRVDGIMRETMHFPKWVQKPVISRIKIMGRLNIAEKRIPQDGRIKLRIGTKALELRVSTLPTQYGETIVMRILDTQSQVMDLRHVGMLQNDYDKVVEMIERPQGIVIVTGPTGCGKSSLLYAMISHIKSVEINIITIEDPIEYELKGVNQVAINEKAGLTFASTLRSVLRQDPDVIMIGEIRDTETATIAHQASMTGHLVFTTLHTNDAVSSIIRLRNHEVPSYMIASALNGIVSLRLMRLICTDCKHEYVPTEAEINLMGLNVSAKIRLFRGAGCKSCGGSGYIGRTGIFEVLTINDMIKDLISEEAPEQEIRKAARAIGMQSLKIDGFKKIAAGLTTLDELSRILYLSKDSSGYSVK